MELPDNCFYEWLLDGGWEELAVNRAVELDNVRSDVGEQNDLALSNPAKRNELLTDLSDWMEETDAKLPAKRNQIRSIKNR